MSERKPDVDIAQTCPHCERVVAYWNSKRIDVAREDIERGATVPWDSLKADLCVIAAERAVIEAADVWEHDWCDNATALTLAKAVQALRAARKKAT